LQSNATRKVSGRAGLILLVGFLGRAAKRKFDLKTALAVLYDALYLMDQHNLQTNDGGNHAV
jgi:hypothetical protein